VAGGAASAFQDLPPLILLRHGHSVGNGENTFSGWLDVPLSDRGRDEAIRAGRLMAAGGLTPDVVHTSALSRTFLTAGLVLEALGRPAVPVHRTWRLNERHYGGLQGLPRAAVLAALGPERFRLLRRSYDAVPPPATPEAVGGTEEPSGGCPAPPRAESLADVRRRLIPYWIGCVVAQLRAGKTPLIVGHSNSLRALCMQLDDLGPDHVLDLHIPTGVPLRYDLDAQLRPRNPGGTYLDPDAAAAGIAEVAAQGAGPTTSLGRSPRTPTGSPSGRRRPP
jgi:2,3-bisphosphoglycerate-dependent phosphoglycerate mutase